MPESMTLFTFSASSAPLYLSSPQLIFSLFISFVFSTDMHILESKSMRSLFLFSLLSEIIVLVPFTYDTVALSVHCHHIHCQTANSKQNQSTLSYHALEHYRTSSGHWQMSFLFGNRSSTENYWSLQLFNISVSCHIMCYPSFLYWSSAENCWSLYLFNISVSFHIMCYPSFFYIFRSIFSKNKNSVIIYIISLLEIDNKGLFIICHHAYF